MKDNKWENQYKNNILSLMPLKTKKEKNYIKDYMKDNPSKNFNLDEEVENIKNNVSVKTKLQDALLVLNKMDNAPMDLILDIKHRLKTIK